ncbi:MAG: response regulator [Spirochaetales bacterium]|nr:response regulator [Spirochaetales bacterium]
MQKILIVEDDVSVSGMVQALLEEEGYQVSTVPSAEKAKEILNTEKPELALVDIILPGQGGMDLILELHTAYPDLKVVLTSGKIDMNKSTFKVLAHQFGVISILPKPFTVEELLETVRDALAG